MSTPLIENRVYRQELYTSALESLWQSFSEVHPISYALREDIDAWERCLKNGAFYQGVQQRLHEVVGDEWHCYPPNNSQEGVDIQAARICEDGLRNIRGFFDALKRQAQAVFRGWSAQYITGARRWCKLGGVWGNWWAPTRIEHVDIRRFKVLSRRQRDNRGRERIKGELWISTIPKQSYEQIRANTETEFYRHGFARVEHPEHFLITVYDDEEARVGRGRGIMDTLYFYVWADQIVMKEGLQALERWAQGVPVGYVDAEARGDAGQDSETERNTMETQLQRMKGRGVFVTDTRNKIEFHNGGGQGHQIVSGWRDYIDSKIIGVATGAILSSGVGQDTGSFARDKEGANVQGRVVQFDRNKISEDVDDGPLQLFWNLNRPQLAHAGLLNAARANFRLVSRRVFEPSEAAARVKTLRDAGIDLPEDEVYEQIAFSQPKKGQKVIKGFEPQQAVPNPFPPFGGVNAPLPPPPESEEKNQEVELQDKPPAVAGHLVAIKPTVPPIAIDPKIAPPTPEPARRQMDQAKNTAGVAADLAVMHSSIEGAEEAARGGEKVPVRSGLSHADNRLGRIRRKIPGRLAVDLESAFVKAWEEVGKRKSDDVESALSQLRQVIAAGFDEVSKSGDGGGLMKKKPSRKRKKRS